MGLCCEFLAFWLSFLFSSHLLLHQVPNFSSPFKATSAGGNGVREIIFIPKFLMHYSEKRHLYSHKAFSVSVCICPPQQGRITSSSQPDNNFPTHLPFLNRGSTQTSTQYLFSLSRSSLSMLEYPVFHLAAHWAVCLASYVTLFLELLPPAHRHCITCQLLCASQ